MIQVFSPDLKTLELISIDLTAPKLGVEVVIDHSSKRVWVNVDGVCILRICQIPILVRRNLK